jgi:hypothetical protein
MPGWKMRFLRFASSKQKKKGNNADENGTVMYNNDNERYQPLENWETLLPAPDTKNLTAVLRPTGSPYVER